MNRPGHHCPPVPPRYAARPAWAAPGIPALLLSGPPGRPRPTWRRAPSRSACFRSYHESVAVIGGNDLAPECLARHGGRIGAFDLRIEVREDEAPGAGGARERAGLARR